MKNIHIDKLISWLIFIISFTVYFLCLPKTITFWDSAEFTASNYTLQNSHPPGAPFYTLIGAIVTGIFGKLNAAFVSNIISSFFGALTIKVLFNVIYIISTNITSHKNNKPTAIIASIVGSLSFAFCYSFWTASTETEVYTLSFLLLIFIFQLALNWFYEKHEKKEKRLLLLIFLFLGISIGVHLINTAIIFPLTLIFFHKKIGFSLKHIFFASISGIVLFFFLFNILFQGLINLTYKTDFYFVNKLSLPVNLGALICLIFIISLLLGLIYLTQIKLFKTLHYSFLCLLFFSIGSSSYITPLIRSQVNAPISNTVKTPLNLKSYVGAEQFGVSKIPLLKGSVYNAPLDNEIPFLDGKPSYDYDITTNKYSIIDDGVKSIENYDKRFNLLFPRVYHQSKINITGYKTWANIKGESIKTKINDQIKTIQKPRFHENLSFFFNYQVNWLYLRYLFKNFIGSQNNLKGTGNITKGNWKSGFNFIDKNRLGDEELIPDYYKNNNSNDYYFYLPFILGLIGLYTLRKYKLFFLTTLFLFITFGLGIILYVNPVPQSILIRERDYIFTASFMFFSIWIGLSVIAIVQFIHKKANYKTSILSTSILCLIISPLQLLYKGFDNQNRKKDIFTYELGKAYLKDCPKQAILITNSDNLTFPLWYLQEVENYRTDVRVINYDQLLLNWYVDKLRLQTNASLPLNLSIENSFNNSKTNFNIPLKKQTSQFLNIKKIASFLTSPQSKATWKEKVFLALPTDNFLLPIKTSDFTIKEKLKSQRIDTLRWSYTKDLYQKNDLIVFDIIASNMAKRPICFAETGKNNHFGLSKFLVNKGMFHQLMPLKRNNPNDNPKIVDTDFAYKSLIKNNPFTTLNNSDSKVTDESIGISRKILRRNSYFLAQAFLEEQDTIKALETISYILKTTPNETIPFQEFAFAIGKLYYRTNNAKKGNEICTIAIQNIEDEIKWISSFNPTRAIINVRYLNRMLKIYEGMILQSKEFDDDLHESKKRALLKIQQHTKTWQNTNWPY